MSIYLLRDVGWIYNDSTYDHDGPRDIIGFYQNENDALNAKAELERTFFVENMSWITHYEVWEEESRDDYTNHIQRLAHFLVDQLDFNPTILLKDNYNILEMSMFCEKPSIELLDDLVAATKVNFFELTELDEVPTTLIRAKISERYTSHPDYLMDYDGILVLTFVDKIAAMKRFQQEELEYFITECKQKESLKGSVQKLSLLPAILTQLVDRSPHMRYQHNEIELSVTIDLETLLQLNELLIHPFLEFEEVPISEEHLLSEKSIQRTRDETDSAWQYIEDRRSSYPSLKRLKESREYLRSYVMPINLNYRTAYLPVIQKYLGPLVQLTERHHELFYGHQRISFYGIVKLHNHVKERNMHTVKSIFGTPQQELINFNQPTFGMGKTIDEAFKNSFANWLQENRNQLAELLKKDQF